MCWTMAVVGIDGNGRFPTSAPINAGAAERSVNIGDDSLPGPWNLVSPSAPNHGNPRKPGGLTDSCSEPNVGRGGELVVHDQDSGIAVEVKIELPWQAIRVLGVRKYH